jgi:hypothetical protein
MTQHMLDDVSDLGHGFGDTGCGAVPEEVRGDGFSYEPHRHFLDLVVNGLGTKISTGFGDPKPL